MIPLIVAGIAGLALFITGLVEAFSDEELKGISRKDISMKYLKKPVNYLGRSDLKTSISKSLKVIIQENREFKIGKTGKPDARQAAHTKFEFMYLLCESKNPKLIETLEDYFISMHIKNPMNRNQRTGSAGKSKSVDGKYYLYVVVTLS